MNASISVKPSIVASGSFLPQQRVTSEEIFNEFNSETKYGVQADWMAKEMGVRERRMSSPSTLPSELAIPAAKQALERAPHINPDHIDMVLFCGIEKDQAEPATAHTIQSALGLKAGIAFDISNACYGFMDGIRTASSFVASGQARYALVVTGEVPTKLIPQVVDQLKKGLPLDDAKDRIGFLSVGDAGGAMIIGPSEANSASGFSVFTSRTSSSHADKCFYKHSASGELDCAMKMAKIVALTTRIFKDMYDDGLKMAGWEKPDYLLVHQVGKKSFQQLRTFSLMSDDQMVKTYDVLGNITSATAPVVFDKLRNTGKLKPGDKVLGCFSGSGIVVGQFAYTH